MEVFHFSHGDHVHVRARVAESFFQQGTQMLQGSAVKNYAVPWAKLESKTPKKDRVALDVHEPRSAPDTLDAETLGKKRLDGHSYDPWFRDMSSFFFLRSRANLFL